MTPSPLDTAATAPTAGSPRNYGAIDRMLRTRLHARLRALRGPGLRIHDACGTEEFGDAAAPAVDLWLHNPSLYRSLASNGSVGAAEAYMDGDWSCDDLVSLVRTLLRNRALLDGLEGGTARFGAALLRCWHAMYRNDRAGARRNIAAHYDLGNDFFGLFLSSDLMYSSAMFEHEHESLEEASRRKLECVATKLELRCSDRVLEIGSGWGGFALHAAATRGCHVTTVTISREQHSLACERVRAAGLEDRVDVQLRDYRDVQGEFDKVASIEMVEAIGAAQLGTYFSTIGRCLRPGGRALVQAITIEDHRFVQALRSVDFIKRHVFPGSFIPSINAMIAAKSQASALRLVHLEDFADSYARTLHEWRNRFHAALATVRTQGYDERFIRLWDFYLAYCEGAFRERAIGVCQLLFEQPASLGAHSRGAG